MIIRDVDPLSGSHIAAPAPSASAARRINRDWLTAGFRVKFHFFVPPERVEAFKAAMGEAGVNLVFNGHDGASHGFTNPDAGSFGIDNFRYDENADVACRRSMLQTFNAVF